MIDHPFLFLQHLIKNYHEASSAYDYLAAYEIATSITEQAQVLENFAQKLLNE